MVHRHPLLYRMLSLLFFSITLVLVFLSIENLWSTPVRTTLFILSLFSFLLTLSYASLGVQEERGCF